MCNTAPTPTAPAPDALHGLYFREAVIMAALDEVQTAIQCPKQAADFMEAAVMATVQFPALPLARAAIGCVPEAAAAYRVLAAENVLKTAIAESLANPSGLLLSALGLLSGALEAIQETIQAEEERQTEVTDLLDRARQ